jgi:hypothetical protein
MLKFINVLNALHQIVISLTLVINKITLNVIIKVVLKL